MDMYMWTWTYLIVDQATVFELHNRYLLNVSFWVFFCWKGGGVGSLIQILITQKKSTIHVLFLQSFLWLLLIFFTLFWLFWCLTLSVELFYPQASLSAVACRRSVQFRNKQSIALQLMNAIVHFLYVTIFFWWFGMSISTILSRACESNELPLETVLSAKKTQRHLQSKSINIETNYAYIK